jgi:hypothetical protein
MSSEPFVTSIIALSRRKLPDTTSNHSKLKVFIMKDFNQYLDLVLSDLSGADACVW